MEALSIKQFTWVPDERLFITDLTDLAPFKVCENFVLHFPGREVEMKHVFIDVKEFEVEAWNYEPVDSRINFSLVIVND